MADYMLALANSFPTLRGVIDHWDPDMLDTWACGTEPGAGALNAARFVLSVWNTRTEWKCGAFNVVIAWGIWDDEHREAFLSWTRKPRWP